MSKKIQWMAIGIVIAALLLASCAPAPPPTVDPNVVNTSVAATVAAIPTVTPLPSSTPLPPPTAVPATPTPQSDPSYNPSEPVAILPTPAAGAPTLVTTVNTVSRAGPGTNYPVQGALNGGTRATVVGISQDKAWWVISVPLGANGQGWVDARFAQVTNASNIPVIPTPPVPPTVNPLAPAASDPQALVLVTTFVRTGPGGTYPAYGVAQPGAKAIVLGKSQDNAWWTVRVPPSVIGAGYAWVEAAYVQASNVENVPYVQSPNPPSPIPTVPAPPAGAPSATALDFVNVRSGPAETYPAYGVARPGASAEVIGKNADGSWWQVKLPTTVVAAGNGWVSAAWVLTQNTQNVPVVTNVPPPPVAGPTPAPAGTCILVSQSPVDNTTLAPGTDFDMKWTVKNTGTKAWDASNTDVVFIASKNNVALHTGGSLYDLTRTVNPGETYDIIVDAVAPSTAGSYGESWGVSSGGVVLCPVYMTINVK